MKLVPLDVLAKIKTVKNTVSGEKEFTTKEALSLERKARDCDVPTTLAAFFAFFLCLTVYCFVSSRPFGVNGLIKFDALVKIKKYEEAVFFA